MRHMIYGTIIVLGTILSPATIFAHHSFAAVFDRDSPVEMTGTVTRVEWTNPHAWFFVDVENDNGEIENWAFEMGSPNHLRRRGWNRNSLQIGEVVTIAGSRARNGSTTGAVRTVTLVSTGQSLFGGQDEAR